MKHWKTNEEMGDGWSHSRNEHEKSNVPYEKESVLCQ